MIAQNSAIDVVMPELYNDGSAHDIPVNTNTVYCESIVGVSGSLTCSFDTSTRTLRISNGFFAGDLGIGTEVQLWMGGESGGVQGKLWTPVTTAALNGFGINIMGQDSNGGWNKYQGWDNASFGVSVNTSKAMESFTIRWSSTQTVAVSSQIQ